MVPDKFDMVDMGGIDLIMMQGEEVPGLYNRLVESITQCRYQCLYNWLFDGVIIPPTYVELEVNENDEVAINEGVVVTSEDVIRIYSIEPGPVDPEIIPLLAEENGVYTAPTGKDGFNPVTVDVPSYTPIIESLSATENGTYNPPSGVDGYAPVIVNVSGVADNDHFQTIVLVEYLNLVGVRITNVEKTNGLISISGNEFSAGYEGVNFVIRDLTIGSSYQLDMSFQTISGGYHPSGYTFGFRLSDTIVNSYPTSSGQDPNYTAIPRDLSKHDFTHTFTATAETMYLVFAMPGYSDSQTNYFEITNLHITDL